MWRIFDSRSGLDRRQFLGGVAVAIAWARSGSGEERVPDTETGSDSARATLRRAVEWLWSQQGADGGWHSETYGLLKSGQALTPVILHTLLAVPDSLVARTAVGVERALSFLAGHANANGCLGRADPEVLEYPNYATAYALRCLVRARRPQDRDLMKRMVAYLAAQQYGPARGFSEQSPAFGGWGFGGDYPPGETGHMDLAHTRHVLQALREAGEVEPAVFTRAQQFLRFVQQHPDDPRPQLTADGSPAGSKIAPYDGGFYFSPMVLGANKGRTGTDAEGNTYFRSYATASCDGLLALLAAGVPRDDERVAAAARWLAKHPRLDYPEGVPRDLPEPWGESIHFYHLAVRSEVYRRLRWPGAWRTEIVRLLDGQQDRCGRFVNRRCHLMKEDDPLLCTTLAVIALSHGS